MSKEREDFIAWYGSNPEQDEHGNYTGAFTQARWETWQAATASAEAKYRPVIEKLVATSNALRNCNRSDFDMTFKEACVLHDEAIALAAPLLGGKNA